MPKDETKQALYMRLTDGSVKAAWLFQAIVDAQEEPGDWVIGSYLDWGIVTGLSVTQIRDAFLILSRRELIVREQKYVRSRRAPLLHVRPSRKGAYAIEHFKPAEAA